MNKTVSIQSDWVEGMQVDAHASRHEVIMDQPESMGGKDAGVNPLELLLIAMGGCLGTVAAIVAKQERVTLRQFSVDVAGDYDVDFLMGKDEGGKGGFLEIRVVVTIDADLADEEKQAFFDKVESRCPVTNSILNKTKAIFQVR